MYPTSIVFIWWLQVQLQTRFISKLIVSLVMSKRGTVKLPDWSDIHRHDAAVIQEYLWCYSTNANYSRRKNNCQKIQLVHSIVTKRGFILRGSYFCEKQNQVLRSAQQYRLTNYTLYIIHYTLYIIHYTLYIIHYTLYIIHNTLYIIHYTLYIIYYILYIIYYTLYIIHYTLYIIHRVKMLGHRNI